MNIPGELQIYPLMIVISLGTPIGLSIHLAVGLSVLILGLGLFIHLITKDDRYWKNRCSSCRVKYHSEQGFKRYNCGDADWTQLCPSCQEKR